MTSSVPVWFECTGVPFEQYSGPTELQHLSTTVNSTIQVNFTVPVGAVAPYNVSLVYQDAIGNGYCTSPINRTGLAADNITTLSTPSVNFTVLEFDYPTGGPANTTNSSQTLGLPGQSFMLQLSGHRMYGGEDFWTTSANYTIKDAQASAGAGQRVSKSLQSVGLLIVLWTLAIQILM